MLHQYPLQIRFKLIALAPRFSITDSSNKEVLYIEQKVLAIREAIRVYNNQNDKNQVYGIKTPQILDFGAQYFFYTGTDEATPIGSIKQEGLKTIFKATYNILDQANNIKFTIIENDPWVRFIDFLFTQIPFLGIFAGYLFHPTYNVIDSQTNKTVMVLKKVPSFLERQFSVELIDQNISPVDEVNCLLGIIMMIQLQRSRG